MDANLAAFLEEKRAALDGALGRGKVDEAAAGEEALGRPRLERVIVQGLGHRFACLVLGVLLKEHSQARKEMRGGRTAKAPLQAAKTTSDYVAIMLRRLLQSEGGGGGPLKCVL